MAWVTSGTSIYTIDYLYPDGLYYDEERKQTVYSRALSCDNNSCLYVKASKVIDGVRHYQLNCVTKKTGIKSNGVYNGSLTETYIDKSGNEKTHIKPYNNTPFDSGFELFTVGTETGTSHGKRIIVNYSGSTSIPVFDDDNEITKYITNGDTSGAIKDVSTKWNLYIDGTKNPLYKLTWDCADVPSSDTSRVKVIYCDFVESVNTFVALSTNYYNYNAKSVKLNYHDIHDAIWGDNDGPIKSAVYIIVQFEYFEKTTVIPKDTSAYMYCELFPNETNGHMFGYIGFCEKGEKTSTFIKTDNGDGSTFTAHDGTDGSDGYTKDDDKGYNDNKDKDDDDDDTHVLSSGIGVLTSTFHMTKDRLVQLGQFLWGSSIFDEFSLINNNPIENIISCKAIPYAISGTTQEITLGNVKTGVNGEKISQNFSKQTIGSVAIAEHYHNFLDYAPYTNVIIYLPYIGFKELDASLVMGKTLRIEYTLDVITGGCLAQIYG